MKKTVAYALLVLLSACSIAYKFNGASIDYTKVKTISVQDFPIRAALVYAPLANAFNEGLRDIYARQTRLQQVPFNGDLTVEGEITGYELTPQAVQENALASKTRLTITVKVRFKNKSDQKQNFDRSFSAFRDFDSSRLLIDVQDGLIKEIVEELTDIIYNATVANW